MLTELQAHVFSKNTRIKAIDLADNKPGFSTLPSGIFDGMIGLRVLAVDRNRIVSLPKTLLQKNTAMTSINAEENVLMCATTDETSNVTLDFTTCRCADTGDPQTVYQLDGSAGSVSCHLLLLTGSAECSIDQRGGSACEFP